MPNQTHERYWNDETVRPSSERSFGLVMAAVFAVLTLINFWHGGRDGPGPPVWRRCFSFSLGLGLPRLSSST
jgi:hypothetical protein